VKWLGLTSLVPSSYIRQFYRALNAVFGKDGRTAPEEVKIQLLKTKRLPVLYYGLEVYPVKNRDQVVVDLRRL